MADDLDNMSDADIRTRLSEFGFPVVPITATTRKTMVKKLRMLMENQKQISKSNRMSLLKYSSGEESDGDSKRKAERSRRYTTVGQMPPPASTKKAPTPVKSSPVRNPQSSPLRQTRKSTPQDATNDVDNESSEGEEPIKTRRVTRLYKTTTTTKVVNDNNSHYNDSVSDSDDDVELLEDRNEIRSSTITRDSPSLTLRSSPTKQSPSSTSTASWKSDKYKSYSSGTESPSALSSHISSYSRHRPSESVTNRYGQSSQSARDVDVDYTNSRGDEPEAEHNRYESPFLSEFTRKLESSKRQYSVLTSPHKTSILSDDSAVSYTPSRDIIRNPISSVNNTQNNYRTFSSLSRRSVPSRTTTAFENIFKKSNIIPLVLVVSVAVFFAFVAFMYVGMKGKLAFQIDSRDHNIPICKEAVSSDRSYGPGMPSRPGVNCVVETSVTAALQLFKYILPELHRRAVEHICQNSKVLPYMTNIDVTEFVKKENPRLELERVLSDLDNLHVLILMNPQWGASIIDKTDNTIMTSLGEVLKSETYQNIAIVIRNPDLPLYCIFSNKLVNIIYTAALVLSGLIVAVGLQFVIKFGLKKREERNKAVYAMVERIVEVLSQESGDGDDSYMAINHVRDRLILPQERKNMGRIWEDAVQFLEQNDSRVRSEVQNVAGEDCRVWRWLATGNHSTGPSSPRNKNKVWQGQAFETQEGSVNNLPVSPTPCLKIRQMIDKHDDIPNLKSVIQDAILEKCGDDCNILHIHVDQQMLCVYVKCASRKDAGIAYRRLHGCWFDGKLITVKYVRLERYMERFPDSPSNPPYLRPSNNKKSSLQFFKIDNSENL